MLADLRFAVRTLGKNKSFAIAAVATLGLGLGASTAMFSVLNAVLMRPLGYTDPDRIVTVQSLWKKSGNRGNASGPDFLDWRARAQSFDGMAYYYGDRLGIVAGQTAEFAGLFLVSEDFFRVMGVRPVAGRIFNSEENQPNGPRVAVVSSAFASGHYGSAAAALGRTIRFANQSHVIAGVLPEGFHYPVWPRFATDIWLPAATIPLNQHRSGHNYNAVARLKPGVTVEQAQSEMTVIAAALEREYPQSNKGKSAAVLRLQDNLTDRIRTTLWVLMAAVGLVLLLACANVANMLLARATSRTREMAVRAAIGGSRARIVRQLVTESAMLGLAGGAAGLLIAIYTTDLLVTLAPRNLPRLDEVSLDASVLVFMAAASMLAVFLFGLVPALHASRVDLSTALKQGAQRGLLGGGSSRLRGVLIAGEIALSFVLLMAAGLLFRSFVSLTSVDMGFRPERLLVATAVVPAHDLESRKRGAVFFRDLLAEARTIPGVRKAAAVMGLPTGHMYSNGAYSVEGRPDPASFTDMPQAGFRVVTADFFATMGTPLLRGRDFDSRDAYEAPLTVIVNERLARQSFTDQDPIGRRIRCGFDRPEWMTIVGVVGDVRHGDPSRPPGPEIYMPAPQHPLVAMDIVVRTDMAPEAAVQAVRERALRLNPEVPLSFTTMDTMLAESVSSPRFRMVLLAAFAVLAAGLAIAGIYGVIAYMVGRRVSEMGLRVALGARASDNLALVLASGLRVTVAGLAIGLALSLAANRVLASMLFEVKPTDPLTYAAALAFVAAIALAATLVPALRASRVDPLEALRNE